MSTEREKTTVLKKKIKALESQIDQKTSLLTSIKHAEISNEERLREIKVKNEARLKNMNLSIARLKQENNILKSVKSPTEMPGKYYLPPIKSLEKKTHSRNVSAGPRLQKSKLNVSESPIDETKDEEGVNTEEINNNFNKEQSSSALNVSTLTKQLELLRKENERLKLKNKQVNDRFHTEVSSKEKELLELRKLKIELGVLKEKFEILSRRNKPRENGLEANNANDVKKSGYTKEIKDDSSLMFLNKRIQELRKGIDAKLQENEKVKEEINRYKVKARALIAEKKSMIEPKEMKDQESQCENMETKDQDSEGKLENKGDLEQQDNTYNNEENQETKYQDKGNLEQQDKVNNKEGNNEENQETKDQDREEKQENKKDFELNNKEDNNEGTLNKDQENQLSSHDNNNNKEGGEEEKKNIGNPDERAEETQLKSSPMLDYSFFYY